MNVKIPELQNVNFLPREILSDQILLPQIVINFVLRLNKIDIKGYFWRTNHMRLVLRQTFISVAANNGYSNQLLRQIR